MGTVIKNKGTSCVGVRKTGTTLIRVSTVMGTLYLKLDLSSGNKISDVIGRFKESKDELSKSLKDDGKYPGMMDKNEWMRIIDNISKRPNLMKLRIAEIKETSSGMKAMVVLSDPKNLLHICVRGFLDESDGCIIRS